MIRQLLALFEECNRQFPIDGDMRHNITLNPETGTLELGIWLPTRLGEEVVTFNLNESLLANPIFPKMSAGADDSRVLLPPTKPSAELPVREA
jgi:hypothetical protein